MRISDWSSDVCSSDLDQAGTEIGEADVADEMRVRRAGGDDGGDKDIPVERLRQHEDAVGDRRDGGDQQQELGETAERVGFSVRHCPLLYPNGAMLSRAGMDVKGFTPPCRATCPCSQRSPPRFPWPSPRPA